MQPFVEIRLMSMADEGALDAIIAIPSRCCPNAPSPIARGSISPAWPDAPAFPSPMTASMKPTLEHIDQSQGSRSADEQKDRRHDEQIGRASCREGVE